MKLSINLRGKKKGRYRLATAMFLPHASVPWWPCIKTDSSSIRPTKTKIALYESMCDWRRYRPTTKLYYSILWSLERWPATGWLHVCPADSVSTGVEPDPESWSHEDPGWFTSEPGFHIMGGFARLHFLFYFIKEINHFFDARLQFGILVFASTLATNHHHPQQQWKKKDENIGSEIKILQFK